VLLDGNYTIDDELSLFTVHTPDRISSEANKSYTHYMGLMISDMSKT
jgi:hypothetical protein